MQALTIVRRNQIVSKLQTNRLAWELSKATDSALVQDYCRVHRCNITLRHHADGRVMLAFSGEFEMFDHAAQLIAHAYNDTFALGRGL